MTEPISCRCGAVLVEEVTAAGVRPLGGDAIIPFRRTTDYVVCASCFQAYDARSLIARTEEAEAVRHLEAMVERIARDEAPDSA